MVVPATVSCDTQQQASEPAQISIEWKVGRYAQILGRVPAMIVREAAGKEKQKGCPKTILYRNKDHKMRTSAAQRKFLCLLRLLYLALPHNLSAHLASLSHMDTAPWKAHEQTSRKKKILKTLVPCLAERSLVQSLCP